MELHWIILTAFNLLLTDTVNGDSSVTTEGLVKKAGYPYEEYVCETSDGYILSIHRIPYSTQINTPSPRPVAFLMHGLLASSNDWVVLGPGKALGFTLSDAGYDVWMGNARGNRYSRKHVTRSPQSKSFWNFSFHEIGMIDLPDMIDYIQNHTKVDQVRYIGHSQGCTTFLILNSLNLKFKSRIKSAHMLAPAIFMGNMSSPLRSLGVLLFGHPEPFVEISGSFEILPSTRAVELLADIACNDKSPLQFVCSTGIFLFAGFDYENIDNTKLPVFFASTPAGSSINQVHHYAQEISSGYFRQFDHGPSRNLITYGNIEPPNYPLEKIDVPIFLYYGKNDYLADVNDVHKTMRHLSNTTLRGAYLVPHPKWNHFDFIWAKNAKEQVYDAVMQDMLSIE